jgi:tetratricopeptide (TPR) repeat protein
MKWSECLRSIPFQKAASICLSALTSLLASPAEPTTRSESPPPAEASRGIGLFEQHEFTKANAVFLADLNANPRDIQAWLYLGRIAFEEDHFDAAEKLFERIIAIAPDSPLGYLWLGRIYGVQARDFGAPRGLGPARRAKRNLEKAVALAPDDLAARADLATFYREAPMIAGGSKHAALVQADEIARRDPYLGAVARGDLAMADKKFDEAARQFESAIKLQPAKTEAYCHRGMFYQRSAQYDKAFADFERILQLNPQEKRAYFYLGKTADLSGKRLKEGAEALERYLCSQPFAMMPSLSWAHRRLGNIFLKQGLRAEARQQYLAALKLDPEDKETIAAVKQLDIANP